MTTLKDEILSQASVFVSDFAKASTDKKTTPDRQDDGNVESRREHDI